MSEYISYKCMYLDLLSPPLYAYAYSSDDWYAKARTKSLAQRKQTQADKGGIDKGNGEQARLAG